MFDRAYEIFHLKWIPARVVICVMMFTACWTSYMCRLQMAVLAVPMIRTKADAEQILGACVDPSVSGNKRRRWVQFVGDHVDDHFMNSSFWQDDSNDTGAWHATYGIKDLGNITKRFPRQNEDPTSTEDEHPPLFSGKPFGWSPFIRGQLVSAYGWGNVPGNLIGGLTAQKFGPRRAILWSSLLAAVLSLLTPLIAQLSWIALALTRIVVGVTGGVTFPACHQMVAHWAPPQEKGRFIWTLQGGTFGSIFLFGIISGIADGINWEAGWYIPAMVMFVWILFWYFLAFDSPEEHPRISADEKEFITSSQAGTVRHKKPTMKETPIREILTSCPFICLVLCHFGNLFLLFFYQTGMMLYLTKSLGFQLTKGGGIAGLPWASRVIFAYLFGWAADSIRKRNLVSITVLRKGATFFSHFLPGMCLIVVGYLGCSFVWANVFLCLALGFNGAASISNLSNNQDLSPNYAGFLYGIMNTFGCLSGIIIPPVIEEIAGKWGNPIHKWQILFWIGAAVCIFCMLVFIVGGSGKVQSWNEMMPSDGTQGNAEAATKRGAAKT